MCYREAVISVVLKRDRELKFIDIHAAFFAYRCLRKLRMPCTRQFPHLGHGLHLVGKIC